MAEYAQADIERLLVRIEAVCHRVLGTGNVSGLMQLSGGASMESWQFSFADHRYILRRLPGLAVQNDLAEGAATVPLRDQAVLMQHALSRGVLVPQVIAILEQEDDMGDGFIMACVEGEALPQRLLADPFYADAMANLSEHCARELARIHAIPIANLPVALREQTPRDALEEQAQFYRAYGSSHPIYSLAFSWLSENCPIASNQVLLHGDFRLGNFLVDQHGLTSVLDWELAHIGDPLQDIAFLCTPSWRFGCYQQEAGGFASLEIWLADYERAAGVKVNKVDLTWWLIFNTLWWGVTCMRMAGSYKDGSVGTMERAVIGRRISEVAIDLLLLLEPHRQSAASKLLISPPEMNVQESAITARDLLSSVREWNKIRLAEEADQHRLFEGRVANNAMGIVLRELALGHTLRERAEHRQKKLGATDEEWSLRLGENAAHFHQDALWDHLRYSAIEALWIDQPHYAGLSAAVVRWAAD